MRHIRKNGLFRQHALDWFAANVLANAIVVAEFDSEPFLPLGYL